MYDEIQIKEYNSAALVLAQIGFDLLKEKALGKSDKELGFEYAVLGEALLNSGDLQGAEKAFTKTIDASYGEQVNWRDIEKEQFDMMRFMMQDHMGPPPKFRPHERDYSVSKPEGVRALKGLSVLNMNKFLEIKERITKQSHEDEATLNIIIGMDKSTFNLIVNDKNV